MCESDHYIAVQVVHCIPPVEFLDLKKMRRSYKDCLDFLKKKVAEEESEELSIDVDSEERYPGRGKLCNHA